MARFELLFTLDYEIHGNGDGWPRSLMVRPTARLVRLLESVGARLTIMADTAELMKYREVADQQGQDLFGIDAIEDQLRSAIAGGHDVQLHVHPSFLKANYSSGRWEQHYEEYSCADLPPDRVSRIITDGKAYLERLLRPVDSTYACVAFRAANWSMHPSQHIVQALTENNIRYDSSVFKHGVRKGVVTFDYSRAPSNIVPWPAAAEDVCRVDPESPLLEVPIYCEPRPIWAFASVGRLRRLLTSRQHPVKVGTPSGDTTGRLRRLWRLLRSQHAWKLDFNQCSARQMVRALQRIEWRHSDVETTLPIVLIGHSKLFDARNERDLAHLLGYIRHRSEVFDFSTFRLMAGRL